MAGVSALDVTVEGLAASFVRPEGATLAALIVPGSGPTDRDGNSPLGVKTDTYRLLARALAEHGIASLRYDKRGIGAAIVKEETLTLDSSAADAAALARSLAAQAGIERVALIGHSEGAIVALRAAREAPIERIALLSAPGFPLGQILRRQLGAKLDATIEAALVALETGGDVPKLDPALDALFRPSVRPFLRSIVNVDPVALLRSEMRPLLVVGGGADLQIGRADFDALIVARPGVESLWLPDLTHTLKRHDPTDMGQARAYTDPTIPIAPELAEALANFLARVLPPSLREPSRRRGA